MPDVCEVCEVCASVTHGDANGDQVLWRMSELDGFSLIPKDVQRNEYVIYEIYEIIYAHVDATEML